MRHEQLEISSSQRTACGFSLIELLVVIAIISLSLAILLPALHWGRALARRVRCQSNLRQIALGCHMYLNDNNQRFYQGVNGNHDFGGWQGRGPFALSRPINPYVRLPLEIPTENGAAVFRCPADSGGVFNRPPQQLAYQYFGNSYQTNFLLIGPDQVPVPKDDQAVLYGEINARLRGLRRDDVSEPSRLLLLGDNNWLTQWSSSYPSGSYWHGRLDCYNFGFLDGHIEFIKVDKGPFVTPDYRVLPFAELDKLALGPSE